MYPAGVVFGAGAQVNVGAQPAEFWVYETGVVTFEEGTTIISESFWIWDSGVVNMAGSFTNTDYFELDNNGVLNIQSTGQMTNNNNYFSSLG